MSNIRSGGETPPHTARVARLLLLLLLLRLLLLLLLRWHVLLLLLCERLTLLLEGLLPPALVRLPLGGRRRRSGSD